MKSYTYYFLNINIAAKSALIFQQYSLRKDLKFNYLGTLINFSLEVSKLFDRTKAKLCVNFRYHF